MAGVVPGLSLFSKMMIPRNRSCDSTASLGERRWGVSERAWGRGGEEDVPLETLCFDPGESGHALSGEGNHSESMLGVVGEHLLVVLGNCSHRGKRQRRNCELSVESITHE